MSKEFMKELQGLLGMGIVALDSADWEHRVGLTCKKVLKRIKEYERYVEIDIKA